MNLEERLKEMNKHSESGEQKEKHIIQIELSDVTAETLEMLLKEIPKEEQAEFIKVIFMVGMHPFIEMKIKKHLDNLKEIM